MSVGAWEELSRTGGRVAGGVGAELPTGRPGSQAVAGAWAVLGWAAMPWPVGFL